MGNSDSHSSVTPFLSVVIPAFNEEARIGPTLDKVTEYLADQSYSWEVIVVDDGSSDATSDVVSERTRSLGGVRLERVSHGGKGWAVRHGMFAASGSLRFMCDADLAMPIGQLSSFVDRMEEGYDVVIGSRQMSGARRFGELFSRHVRGRVFSWFVSLVAVGGYADTQCGFKCFRSEAADRLFGLQRTRGMGFDVEVLYLARKLGLRVVEIPIDWYHNSDSSVRGVVDSLSMFKDTLKVRLHDLKGGYEPESGP